MTATFGHEAAKRFVRDKLGCQCHDSVFERIDYQENVNIVGQEMPAQRLLIGNRLLIYILRLEDVASLSEILPRLVRNARSERDSRGYNRLRVVIAADQANAIRPEAERLFAGFEEVDPNVHLHVLGKAEIGGVFFSNNQSSALI